MRRAVRMAPPCTDRGTIWLCFQVLRQFLQPVEKDANTNVFHDPEGSTNMMPVEALGSLLQLTLMPLDLSVGHSINARDVIGSDPCVARPTERTMTGSGPARRFERPFRLHCFSVSDSSSAMPMWWTCSGEWAARIGLQRLPGLGRAFGSRTREPPCRKGSPPVGT